jgi:hypothetical protein
LAHFVRLIAADRRIASVETHARRVRQSLAHLEAPTRVRRLQVNAGALANLIRTFKRQGLSRSAALQFLRSRRGIACQQERFARVWNRTSP